MTDLRKLCREQYAVRLSMRQDIPTEFKRALKTHERVPVMIDNLARELNSPAMRKRKLSKQVIIDLVYDMTDMFIAGAMKHANERGMSVLEKQRRVKEQEDLQRARDFADSLIGEEEVSRDAKGNEISGGTVQVEAEDLRKLEQLK